MVASRHDNIPVHGSRVLIIPLCRARRTYCSVWPPNGITLPLSNSNFLPCRSHRTVITLHWAPSPLRTWFFDGTNALPNLEQQFFTTPDFTSISPDYCIPAYPCGRNLLVRVHVRTLPPCSPLLITSVPALNDTALGGSLSAFPTMAMPLSVGVRFAFTVIDGSYIIPTDEPQEH